MSTDILKVGRTFVIINKIKEGNISKHYSLSYVDSCKTYNNNYLVKSITLYLAFPFLPTEVTKMNM